MIAFSTDPGSATTPNEDWVGATMDALVVLDGLSAPQGVGGCHHGTPWYVARLGASLLHHTTTAPDLQHAVAFAIQDVADLHSHTCDLGDPGTPSATVAVVRRHDGRLEGLVLADSPILVETVGGDVEVLTDTRVSDVAREEQAAALAAPAGDERDQRVAELVLAQRRLRNTSEGYWIAQADPEAASHALTQSWDAETVARVAAMTDGASRLVDTYERLSWRGLIEVAATRGPEEVIAATRACEAKDPAGTLWPRYKAADDATIAIWSSLH